MIVKYRQIVAASEVKFPDVVCFVVAVVVVVVATTCIFILVCLSFSSKVQLTTKKPNKYRL